MINGGGLVSMLTVFGTIALASLNAGLLSETGVIKPFRKFFNFLNTKIGNYPTLLLAALTTALITFNQILTVILTKELTSNHSSSETQADDLGNTAAVIPAIIPWSIACVVPLSIIDADVEVLTTACYIYSLPLLRLIPKIRNLRKTFSKKSTVKGPQN